MAELNKYTISDLKIALTEHGISDFGKMGKQELIQLLVTRRQETRAALEAAAALPNDRETQIKRRAERFAPSLSDGPGVVAQSLEAKEKRAARFGLVDSELQLKRRQERFSPRVLGSDDRTVAKEVAAIVSGSATEAPLP